jgi:hypothetical protein
MRSISPAVPVFLTSALVALVFFVTSIVALVLYGA